MVTFLPGKSFLKSFHLLWLIPIFYLFFLFTINLKIIEKFDYFFSKNVDFNVEQHIDTKFWLSNYIIIENQDTIYYNQNSNWENWFSKEELKKL